MPKILTTWFMDDPFCDNFAVSLAVCQGVICEVSKRFMSELEAKFIRTAKVLFQSSLIRFLLPILIFHLTFENYIFIFS